MSHFGNLLQLVLEVVAILAAIAAANQVRRRFPRLRLERELVAGLALSASVIVLVLSDLHGAGSAFSHARREVVGGRAGLEQCVDESLSGAPLVPYRHRFVSWVKAHLPAHAVYSLVAEAGAPDVWCLTLVWLPALPAGPGERAGWTIAFGVLPPDLRARIARHDPTVEVFAPRFALARHERG